MKIRVLRSQHVEEGAYERDQRDPEFTTLLNDALGSAIRASIDDPVVDPSNTEDTTCRLHDIECKDEKLSQD